MRAAPVRFLLVTGGAALVLAGAWWGSGVRRALVVMETLGQAEERAAIQALVPVLAREAAVLEEVRIRTRSSAPIAALREDVLVRPGSGDTLAVGFESPGEGAREAAASVLAEELSKRVAMALPDLRDARIRALSGRLRILDAALQGPGSREEAGGSDPRALLEVERDEALRELAGLGPAGRDGGAGPGEAARRAELERRVGQLDELLVSLAVRREGGKDPVRALREELGRRYSDWMVREHAPGVPLRRLTGEILRERERAAPWPYALLWLVVAALFAVLEFLIRPDLERAAAVIASGQRHAAHTIAGALREEGARPVPPLAPPPRDPAPAPVPPEPEELPVVVLGRVRELPRGEEAEAVRLARNRRGTLPEPFPELAAKVGLLLSRRLRDGRGARILQVVSLRPGAGSTFVAVNLARALAGVGRPVALVDANLRRPRLHEVFDLDGDEGLTDLLIDRSLEEVLPPPAAGEPSVLVAGPPPPSPEELLASPRLDALCRTLAERVELTLFDTPPFHDGPDALLAAAVADATLLVVPADLPDAELAEELVDLLALEVPVLGLVHVGPEGGTE